MTKSIRLTVEWDGAADEIAYGNVIADSIEAGDSSKVTRVVSMIALTNFGPTQKRHISRYELVRHWFWRISRRLRGDPFWRISRRLRGDPFWPLVALAVLLLVMAARRGG